jgi:hypothetical protein
MNPGEYPQPLVRKTFLQIPVVSGYVTGRLQAQDQYPPAVSGITTPVSMLVTLENVGETGFTVQLREMADRSVSGIRYSLGSAVTLAAGGQSTINVGGKQPYLEVYCTGTTTGELRMQIDSQRRWTPMGFDRSDPFYPPQLWQGKVQPPPILS